MSAVTVVWLRQDLRLEDQPALAAAARRGAVVPVYVWSPDEEGDWPPGAASRVWLHDSLAALERALGARGSRLVLRCGDAGVELARVCAACSADAVYWTRRYEPAPVERDTALKSSLRAAGIDARSFAGALLGEPHEVSNRQRRPFRVFTPFYKHCRSLAPPAPPEPAPPRLDAPATWPDSEPLAALGLEPALDWAGGIRERWTPGAEGARRELEAFVDGAIERYAEDRDRPDRIGVSRLSPHLHHGEISPRQVWHAIAAAFPGRGEGQVSVRVEPFVRQLYWREFAHHLLYHFPHTPDRALDRKFDRFPWRRDAAALAAWQRGRTGYPLIDAGMRELWRTGWMHNRVRMNVASFLVKHLLIHWIEGTRWFWDTLVDADLANNTLGWQWAAGCGADAAPYFRIFNPVVQARRFDPAGAYVRRWLPELARLPDAHVHAPWEAPGSALRAAGVRLGRDYPHPLVDHRAARARALEALARSRET